MDYQLFDDEVKGGDMDTMIMALREIRYDDTMECSEEGLYSFRSYLFDATAYYHSLADAITGFFKYREMYANYL